VSSLLTVQRVTVDPGDWVDIQPPQNCDNVLIGNLEGAGVLRLRTVKTDPDTEMTISAGAERMIAAPANLVEQGRGSRFSKTAVAFSLKPDAGTGPVVLTWC
jgi:hypothetical protein